MKKSIPIKLMMIVAVSILSMTTFACPYKSFDDCLVEIGKNLPPDFKPFIEKQCQALGCKNLTSNEENLSKKGIRCEKKTKKRAQLALLTTQNVRSN